MRSLFIICLTLVAHSLWAQPSNDDCLDAILIPTTTEYCSEPMEFTNVLSTTDIINPASAGQMGVDDCVLGNLDNGIWFIFFPEQPGIIVTINCGTPNGNCLSPGAILFEGSCTSAAGLEYVSCTPGNSLEVAEYTVTGLTVGQRYYLFVKSDDPGTMQLCVDDFVPVPSPESDCPDAVVLCDKTAFQIDFLNTNGDDATELNEFTDRCLDSEFNSSWYKWTCKDAGTLTFTLDPNGIRNGEPDDLDFALFELPNGLDDCANKDMIRCMASGGCSNNFQDYIQCTGPTGLSDASTDTEEDAGCFGSACSGPTTGAGDPPQPDDNFVSAVNMVAGRSYALVVMNFSSTGQGFSIEFGGTGTFLGPEPDFNPVPVGDTLACDKAVIYTDLSEPNTDPIVSWSWNFGEGAEPLTSTSQGPIEVTYDSFGEKFATLTVESSRGCLVTKIISVRVGACCDDFEPPVLDAFAPTQICPGETDGEIQYGVFSGGTPEFTYNVSPVDPPGVFIPNLSTDGLGAGVYTVIVQDQKGCLDTAEVTLSETDPVFVDAGLDIELELGAQDVLTAVVDPPGADVTYAWSSTSTNATVSECLTPGLDCAGSDTLDCFDPVVTAQGTQTFTVIITDENGCTAFDDVIVTTNVVRPIYMPNVMGEGFPGDRNDVFRLGFGNQVKLVKEFHIFDRWGNIIYTATDVELDGNNEMAQGWDGRFGKDTNLTKFVNPGVYVWFAKVLFIDGELLPYAGDVTIVR